MLKEKEEIIRNLTAASEAAMVAAEAEAELLLGPEVEAGVDTSTVLAELVTQLALLLDTETEAVAAVEAAQEEASSRELREVGLEVAVMLSYLPYPGLASTTQHHNIEEGDTFSTILYTSPACQHNSENCYNYDIITDKYYFIIFIETAL